MIPFPNKRYQVIYADPAWSYRNKSTGGSQNSGSEQKYDTMSTDEICAMPVQAISDKNCVLFLWGTTPMLPEAFQVMSAWGFEYKTAIYWRKIMSMGMGFWFRGQVEVCLVGIRGNIKAFHSQKPNFIQTHVEKHSKKPRVMRGWINEIAEQYHLSPKIELFSRDKIEGWDCWGNQTPTSEQKLLAGVDECSG